MKKSLSILLSVLLLALLLSSCNTGSGQGGEPGTNQGGPVPGGDSCSFGIVAPRGYEYSSSVIALLNSIRAAGHEADLATPEGEGFDRLIVIGLQECEISQSAYKRLGRLRIDDTVDYPLGAVSRLLYSDGKDLALAYTESGGEELMFDSLGKLSEDIVGWTNAPARLTNSETVSYYSVIAERDSKMLEEAWSRVEAKLGMATTSALKYFYGLYSDGFVTWLANLFEPEVCACDGICLGTRYCGGAGFYYSNSARDNIGFLPDAESTKQALSTLQETGMLEEYGGSLKAALPEDIRAALIRYLKGLQDEDGYFYHPQWGKEVSVSRRGRDLNNCTATLKSLGSLPTYDAKDGTKGDGILPDGTPIALSGRLGESASSAASRVTFASAVLSVSSSFENNKTLLEYLGTLDIKGDPYGVGNTLQAQMTEIIAADARTPDRLVDTLINWITENQNENGIWNDEYESNYAPVNGIMKLSMVYIMAGKPLPRPDKMLNYCIKAMLTDEEPYAITDVRNAIDAFNMIASQVEKSAGKNDAAMKVINGFRADPVAAISSLAKKFGLFLRTDGSFGYYINSSSATSQGCAVAISGTLEGDVNATSMTVGGVPNMLFGALGASGLRVPTYTDSDWRLFLSIMEGLGPVIKQEMNFVYDGSTDSSLRGSGKYRDGAIDYTAASASKLVADGVFTLDSTMRADYLGVGSFIGVTKDGGDDALIIGQRMAGEYNASFYPRGAGSSVIFETDVCILGGKTTYADGGLLMCYFMQDDAYNFDPSFQLAYKGEGTDGIPYWQLTQAGTGTAYPKLKYGEWHNLRIEIQDITSNGAAIRAYIDGVLVARTVTGIYSGRTDLTCLNIRFRGNCTSDSLVLLDNTYFVRTDDLYDDPAEPDIPEEKPKDEVSLGGYRGKGVNCAEAEGFTDGTVKALKADGELVIKSDKGFAKNPEKNNLKIPSVDGDDALKLSYGAAAESRFFFRKKVSERQGLLIEADIMLKDISSVREDGGFMGFYLSKSAEEVSTLWGLYLTLDGSGALTLGSESLSSEKSEPLKPRVWYNLRIETDGFAAGDNAYLYLNGNLLFTLQMKSGIDGAVGVDALVLNGGLGSLYFDNLLIASSFDPDYVPPAPDIPSVGASDRGAGAYYEGSEKYGGRASVSEIGAIVAGLSEGGGSNYVALSELSGDSVLELTHKKSGTSRFSVASTAEPMGDKLLFESDIMIKGLSTTRTDAATFTITGTGDLAGNAGKHRFSIGFSKDGPYDIMSVMLQGVKVFSVLIPDGEWFNLRLEYEGKTAQSELRVYLNGVLSYATTLGGSLDGVVGAQIIGLPNMLGSIFLDNTTLAYLSSFSEGEEGEPTEPPSGGEENAMARLLPYKGGANGVLVLMHDDGSHNTMAIVDPLLEKYGLVADLALFLANGLYDFEADTALDGYKGWVPYLSSGRWKLVSHSATHAWFGSEVDTDGDGIKDTLVADPELIKKEVLTSRDILRSLFPGQRVLTFAYPGYSAEKAKYGYSAVITDAFKKAIAEAYIAGRNANNSPITDPLSGSISWEELGAISLDYDKNVSAALEALTTVSTSGGLATFYMHRVAEMTAEEIASGSYANNTMSREGLERILKAASGLVDSGVLWCANYEDAVMYLREARTASLTATGDENAITVILTDEMDDAIYNHPLTVAVTVPESWRAVRVTQGEASFLAAVNETDGGFVAKVDIIPNGIAATLEPVDGEEYSTLTAPSEVYVNGARNSCIYERNASVTLTYKGEGHNEDGLAFLGFRVEFASGRTAILKSGGELTLSEDARVTLVYESLPEVDPDRHYTDKAWTDERD